MEYFFTCPYCWEEISILIDPDQDDSVYIEDCEVCCRPIELNIRLSGEKIIEF